MSIKYPRNVASNKNYNNSNNNNNRNKKSAVTSI